MDIAVYTRISDDREGRGLGVARQESDCLAATEARGWNVADVYCDNDTSAYRGKPRPAYERMLADIEAGRVGGVVAWHPDRLHRSPVELERFIDIVERHHVAVLTVQGGEYDLSTAAGRMTARVVGAVARHESEHKSERQRRKHLELAQSGRNGGGGHRPFGYSCYGAHPGSCAVVGCPHDGTLTVIEPEAEAIREAARRLAAGESLRGVVADLNARGIPTTRGRAWSQHVFRRMITSPRVAGLREYQGRSLTTAERRAGRDIIGPAVWPAIIDRATWEQTRRILLDPERRLNRSARRYLLTGLARCGLCDAKLVARPRSDKRRSMVCATGPGFSGCGKIRILAEPLEDLVAIMLIIALDGPDLAAALDRHRRTDADYDVMAKLSDIENQLDLADADHADGTIDRRSWLNLRRHLTAKRDALQHRLSAQMQTNALQPLLGAGDLAERWAALRFDQQRAALAVVIDRVLVAPAVKGRNFFDPNRVNVVWSA